jgi:hypothetical protein
MKLFFRALMTSLVVILMVNVIALPLPVIAQTLPAAGAEKPPAFDFGGNFNGTNLGDLLPEKGNPKLDSTLNSLISGRGNSANTMTFSGESDTGEPTIRVIIESMPGAESAAAEAVRAAGTLEIEYNGLLQVNLPVSVLAALADNENISFIRLPYEFQPCVMSEGVSLINATSWQNAGYTGAGVKIGILDGGFAGYQTLQSQGELPASITTHWSTSLGGPGSSIHGAACAEIIYDIAPDASYYFANCSTDLEYPDAVNWLISQHVDIISSSGGFMALGPGDGTGPIDQVVDLTYNAGIFWSQSAGNYAQQHWSGNFVDDGYGFTFFSGSYDLNVIPALAGDTISAALNWNDPWGYSANDYDLLLIDQSDNVVAFSNSIQDGNDRPLESLTYTATYTGYYAFAIYKKTTAAARTLNLFVAKQPLLISTPSGSLAVPADSIHVLTVGAVPWNDPATIEPFSSQGPNAAGVVKPDIVTPDKVKTVTYGSSFPGTSAAAPCAAGAAAIIKQANPTFTNVQIKSYMESHTVDLGTTGKDNIYGSGRLSLPNPPAKISFTTTAQTIAAGAASGLITVQTQDNAGNPLNMTSNTGISLTTNSNTGRFDTSASGAFNLTTTTVTIQTGQNSASFYYKDTVRGTPTITAAATGITNITSGTQQETITANTATKIRVETAADGSGTVVAAQNLTAGSTLTVYGITRDQYNNFVGNPADTTWSLVSKTSGVADVDLIPTTGVSTTLTAHLTGTAIIHPSNGTLTATDSGIITVVKNTLDHLLITTQPTSTLSVDSPLSTSAVVTAYDIGNNPLSGISITADRDPATGTGTLRGTTTVNTSANGSATFTTLGYNRTDVFKVRFTAGSKTIISDPIGPLSPGTAAQISIATAPVIGASVDVILATQPVILVKDQFNNPKDGIAVTVSRNSGTGTVRGTLTVTTNTTGLAGFTDLGYNKSGESFSLHFVAASLNVNSGSLGPLTAGAATQISLATAPITGASVDANLATQPVILVQDQYSNPINGTEVTASLGTGSGTLRGALTATANTAGRAAFTNLGYNKAGEGFTLHFTAGSLDADSQSLGPLAAGAAAQISIATPPAAGASVDAVLATQPVILLKDQYDNPKGGVAVTVSLASGTGALRGASSVTSNATGYSAFTNLGYSKAGETFVLQFAASSLSVNSASLGPLATGATSQISVATAPTAGASVDANLSTQPVILLKDQYNNPVSDITVTASLATGTGTLRGTLIAATNTAGRAAFTNLGYNKAGEAFTLHFAAGSLAVNSGSLSPLAAGAAAKLNISTPPAAGASVDANLTTQPVILVQDQYDNPVSGTVVTATRGSGSGSLRGTIMATTNTAGLAAFANLGYKKAGEVFTLRFTAGSFSIDSQNLGPLAAGAATQISLATTPVIGASVDTNLSTQPVILLKDQFDNPKDGVDVTVSRGSGTGTLRGTLTVTANATGLAAFTDLGYNKSAEKFNLHFAADNLSLNSGDLGPINAGAATQIRVETKGDGLGTIVGAQSLETKHSLTVYGVTRDQYDNYAGNPADTAWSLINKHHNIADSDLTPVTGASTTLNGLGAGSAIIHAVNGSLTSVDSGTITVNMGPPKFLTIIVPPTADASVDIPFTTQPRILVTDEGNNGVGGITVTVSRGSGSGALRGTMTAISDIDGLAAFNDLGYNKSGEPFSLHFAAGSISVNSDPLGPLSAGAPTSIKIATASVTGASVDANLSTQPVILVQDQYNNPNSGIAVTASLNSGSGTLRGNATATTNAAGQAVFTDLGYNKSDETFSLHFAAGSLSVDSGSLGPLAAGAAAKLTISTQPVAGASVDANLATQPVILVQDQYDNPKKNIVLTASLATGTGILRGTPTATSNAAGLAAFTNLGYNKAADPFSIRFSAGSLSIDSLTLGPLAPGAATHISLATAPAVTTNASVDANLSTQPVILLEDQYNNPKDGVAVTVSRGSGTGNLRGTMTVTTNATGLAAFTDLGYSKSGETFTLHFAAGNLSTTSAAIGPLTAGTAKKISVETAEDGRGTIAGTQALLPGEKLMVFGITRDQFDNLNGNPANTNWSLVNKTGGVADGDLSASTGSSTTLTGNGTGSAVIEAAQGVLTPGNSGTIYVNPLPPSQISAATIPAVGASVDDPFATQPVILVTDNETNPVGGISITVSRGSGTGTLRGTLTVTTNGTGLAAFTDLGYNKSGETFNLKFVSGNLTRESADLGPLAQGAPAGVQVETAADGHGAAIPAQNLDVGKTLAAFCMVRDHFGNMVDNAAGIWSLANVTGGIVSGDLVPSSDNRSAVFTAHLAGSACIEVSSAGFSAVDSGTITVVTPAPPAPAGGGMGPANVTLTTTGFTSKNPLIIDASGIVQDDVQLQVEGTETIVNIAKKTKLVDVHKQPLEAISVTKVTAPDNLPPQTLVIEALNFGPEGATFDPAITLTFSFKTTDLPAGVAEQDLYVVYWDGTKWAKVKSTLNATTHNMAAQLTHFSTYALVEPTPANISLHDLEISPQNVSTGDKVSISITVSNTGGKDGNYPVKLSINGVQEQSINVAVKAGDSQKANFEFMPKTAGKYTVKVNDLSGELIATLPSPTATATQSSTPTATATSTPPASPSTTTTTPFVPVPQSVTATPPVQTSPPSQEKNNTWMIIGISIAAVLIIGVVVVIVVSRRIKGTPKQNN